MRSLTVSVIGAGCCLVATPSSSADLVGIVVEQITTTNSGNEIPAGLHTIRISAQFDDPADQLIGVIGSMSSAPLRWTVASGGTWWNSDMGGDGPPLFGVEESIPEVGWDSYMTIGLSNTNDGDELVIAPGTDQAGLHGSTVWNGGAGGPLNVGWLVPPTEPDGTPMAQSVAGNSPGNRVLLAQMTVALDGEPLFIEGTMGLLFQVGGVNQLTDVGFSYIPAPAAVAVLAIGGLGLVRRRRPA